MLLLAAQWPRLKLSKQVDITMKAIPTVLLLVSLSASGEILFTWDPVTGADGYYFYCEPTPLAGGPYTPDETIVAPEVTFDAEPFLPVNVQHECWVTAYDAATESADSNHYVLTNPGPFQVIQTLTPPGNISFTIQQSAQ